MDSRVIAQQSLRRFARHAVVAVVAGIVLAAATAASALAAVSSNRALGRTGTRAAATVVRVEHSPFRFRSNGSDSGMLIQQTAMNRRLTLEAAWRTESIAEIGPQVIALGPKPLLFRPAGFRLRAGRARNQLDSTLVAQGPSRDMLVITKDGFVIRARPPASDRQGRALERRYRAMTGRTAR